MRNFFVYARSKDNQFFSCAVQVSSFAGQDADDLAMHIEMAARRELRRMGNPLPGLRDLVRFRAVSDGRCDLDASGYGPVLEPGKCHR